MRKIIVPLVIAGFIVGSGCANGRHCLLRLREPVLPPKYHRADGENYINRGRLLACVETLPENDRSHYLVLRDERRDIVFIDPFYGSSPTLDWLAISGQDNLLLLTYHGGGTAGRQMSIYKISWTRPNHGILNALPCVLYHRIRCVYHHDYVGELEFIRDKHTHFQTIRFATKDYEKNPLIDRKQHEVKLKELGR